MITEVIILHQNISLFFFFFGPKYWATLTLKAPSKICSRRHSIFFFFFFFFRENKSWHFMLIDCQADDSHEMSRHVFSEKENKKKIVVCCNCDWGLKGSHYYICSKIRTRPFYYLLKQHKCCWMSGKQCRLWSDATLCSVWSGSILFAQACLSQYLGLIQ